MPDGRPPEEQARQDLAALESLGVPERVAALEGIATALDAALTRDEG